MLGATLLLFTTAFATPSASPSIRAGTYDIVVTYGGGELQGTLEIAYVRDSLTAALHVGEHNPAIRNIVVEGAKLTLTGGAEGMAMVYVLTFEGDSVSGTLVFNDADGTVKGKRRPRGT